MLELSQTSAGQEWDSTENSRRFVTAPLALLLSEVHEPALMLPASPELAQVGEITLVLPASKTAAARAEIILTETLR